MFGTVRTLLRSAAQQVRCMSDAAAQSGPAILRPRSSKVRVLVADHHNPWFNLATEDWIFGELDPSVQTLFVWRNDKTVLTFHNSRILLTMNRWLSVGIKTRLKNVICNKWRRMGCFLRDDKVEAALYIRYIIRVNPIRSLNQLLGSG